MRLRAILALILTLLLVGCGQSTRINVEWTVHSTEPGESSSIAAMSLRLEDSPTVMPLSHPTVVTIETEGMNLGYQVSTMEVTQVEVKATLVGADRRQPFVFHVVSDDVDYPWQQIDDRTVLIEPIAPGNGVLIVRYEELGLESVVPFAIAPVFVLVYSATADPGEGYGISFATGQAQPEGQGDIYMNRFDPHVFAPWGYTEEPMPDFWDQSFWGRRDVRDLELLPGTFTIQLGRLYTVKTEDGGYAMFYASSYKGEGKWNLIWRYSPDGVFE